MVHSQSNVVNAKHMHHIPFSFAQITALLLGLQNTGENPKRDEMLHWKEFILKVDLVFAARYHLMRRRLVEDFEPFDPNRTEAPEHPPSKMALVEDRFFSHLREMLERANFSLLSGEDAEDALSHNFINTIPIEPEWLKLDPVFSRYLDAHPDLAKEAPPFASRLWVFHRGMGAATFSGLLIMQKIDMLLMSLLGRCCGKRKKDKKKTGTSEASADASAAAAVAPSLAVPADGAGNSNSGVTYVEGVKRVSLESQMKTGGWGALFKPVFMQEPTFKYVGAAALAYRLTVARQGGVSGVSHQRRARCVPLVAQPERALPQSVPRHPARRSGGVVPVQAHGIAPAGHDQVCRGWRVWRRVDPDAAPSRRARGLFGAGGLCGAAGHGAVQLPVPSQRVRADDAARHLQQVQRRRLGRHHVPHGGSRETGDESELRARIHSWCVC